jgi:endonuclease G, mitochondrial
MSRVRLEGGPPPVAAPKAATSAKVTPVSIAEVEKRFGWATGTWQDKLLKVADGAGNKDGKVTRTELDAYLANPKDLQFITSQGLSALGKKVATGSSAIDGMDGWTKAAATAADTNHDGNLAKSEFTAYAAKAKDGVQATRTWLPDQSAAIVGSDVASMTQEKDALLPQGFTGPVLPRQYMRIVQDDNRLAPQVVSYRLTAADIEQTPKDVVRKNQFHQDRDWKPSPTYSDYKEVGFDRGHMKPAEDSPDKEAMKESFLMTNMAPQQAHLNQASWRYLEAGVNQLVQATGGQATVHTGNLYLDGDGKPLPPEKIQYVGSGSRRIAVPTHCFKAVELVTPDGKKQLFAFVVPNKQELGTTGAAAKTILADSRVSVAALEKTLGGVDLFPDLSATEAKALKPIGNPTIRFQNPDKYDFANLVWPQS